MDPIKCGPDRIYAHMIPPPQGLKSKVGIGIKNWICLAENSPAGMEVYGLNLPTPNAVWFWYSSPSPEPKHPFEHVVVKAFYREGPTRKSEKPLTFEPVNKIVEGGMTWYKLKATIPRPPTINSYLQRVIFYRKHPATGSAYFGHAEFVDVKGRHDITSEWSIEKADDDCSDF